MLSILKMNNDIPGTVRPIWRYTFDGEQPSEATQGRPRDAEQNTINP